MFMHDHVIYTNSVDTLFQRYRFHILSSFPALHFFKGKLNSINVQTMSTQRQHVLGVRFRKTLAYTGPGPNGLGF